MFPDHAGAGPDRQDWTTSRGTEPDAALYFALNPDLASAFAAGAIRSAAEHWRDCGMQEMAVGARPALLDQASIERRAMGAERQDASLAAGHYLGMNPDLLAAFGNDEDAALRHWIEHGSLEGRVAAGDAPHRDRAPDLAALLARPFGIDLYLPADEVSPAAVAGRRLLECARQARIPATPRPFVERDDMPFLSEAEAGRSGTFRVSLIVASPQTLRRLLRAYPAAHFDQSYVVAFWPVAALARHMPDYPTFGAVDELWVPSATARDRLAAVAPVPVRLVELPAATLPPRHLARNRLGLPADMFAVLLDAPLVSDGQGGLLLANHVAPAIEAFRVAFGEDRTKRLIVRAGASAIVQAQKAINGRSNALVLGDQRQDGASLPLAAADAMIASDGLDIDRADALAGGRVVLAHDAVDLAALLRRAAAGAPRPARAAPDPRASDRIHTILTGLGLDAPAPAFAQTLGRSRTASNPVPRRPPGRSWSPSLPVLSILLDSRFAFPSEVDQAAAALAAQPWPFWELCIAGSGRLRDRSLLPADPRIRLAAGPPDTTMTAAITRAATIATGTHLIIGRSAAEAMTLADALPLIATHLASDPAADTLLASEPSRGRDLTDRIEAGGPEIRPVAYRRDAFIAAGGLRDRHDPASEYALLLALLASRARIARCAPATVPVRDGDAPAAEEAGRLALQAHLSATAGPLAYAVKGLRPNTYRRRRHLMRPTAMTVVHPVGTVLPALDRAAGIVTTRSTLDWSDVDLATEYLLFLDGDIVPATDAMTALLELIVEDEIGVAGGQVRHGDGTLDHGGLRLAPDGGLLWPGRGLLDHRNTAASVVHNPDAVGGVLATRRSVLLQLGGFDRSLREAGGVTFDLLAADFCLRCRVELGLRTTYTPFAVFERGAARPVARIGSHQKTPAETMFASRWQAGVPPA